MQDVSGTGLSLTVIAASTYPSGFVCKAFADDIKTELKTEATLYQNTL